MAGAIEVLNVGLGDLRLTVTEGNALEIEKAKRVITDMLNRGYAVFVEEPGGELKRVKRFRADRLVYVLDDTMDTVPAKVATPDAVVAQDEVPRRKRREKEVPVTATKAVAVGRSAGG